MGKAEMVDEDRDGLGETGMRSTPTKVTRSRKTPDNHLMKYIKKTARLKKEGKAVPNLNAKLRRRRSFGSLANRWITGARADNLQRTI